MDREDVKQALLKAYEAGWRGSLELKEEYAEDAVFWLIGPEEKEEEKKELQNRDHPLGWTVGGGASDQSAQAWSYNTFSDVVSVSSEWVADRSNWSTIEIPDVEISNAEILESPDLEEGMPEIVLEEIPLSDSFEGSVPDTEPLPFEERIQLLEQRAEQLAASAPLAEQLASPLSDSDPEEDPPLDGMRWDDEI